MKMVIRTIAVLFISLVPAFATDSLTFNGHGYSLDVIVGGVDSAQITDVHLSTPRSDQAVLIKAAEFKVRRGDYSSQRLTLVFINPSPDHQKPSFKLKVSGGRGVLTIHGKRIRGVFDWQH